MTRSFLPATALIILAGTLSADVTFTQTTRILGGAVFEATADMNKAAGLPVREPQHDEVCIKGNKMARLGQVGSLIYDLDSGTVTIVNRTNRTYQTYTFADMQRALSRGLGSGFGAHDFEAKVESTGRTKVISGEMAREVLVTVSATGPQNRWVVKSHAWLIPVSPENAEIVAFFRKMNAKYVDALSGWSSGAALASPGVTEALSQLAKQDGYAVQIENEFTGILPASQMDQLGIKDPNAVSLKSLWENANFVRGDIDQSKFAVPSGFTEEKSPPK